MLFWHIMRFAAYQRHMLLVGMTQPLTPIPGPLRMEMHRYIVDCAYGPLGL